MDSSRNPNDERSPLFVSTQHPNKWDNEVEMGQANGSSASELAHTATTNGTPAEISGISPSKHDSIPAIENTTNPANEARDYLLLDAAFEVASGATAQNASSMPPASVKSGEPIANNGRSKEMLAAVDWGAHPYNEQKPVALDPLKVTSGTSDEKADSYDICNVQSLANNNNARFVPLNVTKDRSMKVSKLRGRCPLPGSLWSRIILC